MAQIRPSSIQIAVVALSLVSSSGFSTPRAGRSVGVLPRRHRAGVLRSAELTDARPSGARLAPLVPGAAAALGAAAVVAIAFAHGAEPAAAIDAPTVAADVFNPNTFKPVCPASDTFYRGTQQSAFYLVGGQSYEQYAPLIAGGLLRVRLELCVLESFLYEAILPFIKENGLSWVLPLHETVETFLTGTIFAVATNFILIGSTKIITVIATYADVFIGLPARLLGGFGWDRIGDSSSLPSSAPKFDPMTGKPLEDTKDFLAPVRKVQAGGPFSIFLVAFGGLRVFGETSKFVRQVTEVADTFVGRYLVFTTVFYVIVKFLHFKIFPDFP
jgi:hypothetical protein